MNKILRGLSGGETDALAAEILAGLSGEGHGDAARGALYDSPAGEALTRVRRGGARGHFSWAERGLAAPSYDGEFYESVTGDEPGVPRTAARRFAGGRLLRRLMSAAGLGAVRPDTALPNGGAGEGRRTRGNDGRLPPEQGRFAGNGRLSRETEGSGIRAVEPGAELEAEPGAGLTDRAAQAEALAVGRLYRAGADARGRGRETRSGHFGESPFKRGESARMRQSAGEARGAGMQEVSDFFRQDSRRYDNGFELY